MVEERPHVLPVEIEKLLVHEGHIGLFAERCEIGQVLNGLGDEREVACGALRRVLCHVTGSLSYGVWQLSY